MNSRCKGLSTKAYFATAIERLTLSKVFRSRALSRVSFRQWTSIPDIMPSFPIAAVHKRMEGTKMDKANLPAFIRGPSVLVPLKIDLTYQGARLVDTFCWDIYCPSITPEEFVARTIADLNLPIGFHHRIAFQVIEQIKSYVQLVDFLRVHGALIPGWHEKIRRPQPITLGIRHNSIDYSDKVDWDPMDEYLTPELFARVTCADLGLAAEIEAAISHKIRESLFRWLINLVQKPETSAKDSDIQAEFKVTDNKISLVPPSQVVDMITNLWKRAKPGSLDDISSVPQPMLPPEKETTVGTWVKKLQIPAELVKLSV